MDFFSTNFILQPLHDHQEPPSSSPPPPLLTSWFPQDFHGVASTTTLLGKRSPSSMLFSGFESYEQQQQQQQEHSTTGDEDLSSDHEIDGSFSGQAMMLGERKKRLNIDQVKTLEKSFEFHGNKLEPDRKLQLAKALGLQPRQVAIWFQNRRARWKTKQLEKDYDVLKRQLDAMKADNDALLEQNQKLNDEILKLKGNNKWRDTTSDLKLINFSTPSSIPDQEQHPIPTSRQFFPPSGGRHTNMFPGIEDQAGLIWPWLDQQHQHINH